MFHCLVASGMWRKNTFSSLLIFPLTNLLKPSIFFLWPWGFILPWW
jgi:hypothetical protein